MRVSYYVFFKQKTAYEMRISDWSSDVCSSDLLAQGVIGLPRMALGAVVRERHLAEADPRHHPADEARLFGQRQQGIERAAAHQPEITGIERDRKSTRLNSSH